ncbi:hypothetical protein B0G84_6218 [Paraburkholderia sp. BL8N3]|nr:hypothetical protein [Paraburkholderia sp. BL8N3]TCK37163.1 hypothetical protein B0G84_6218 [Paraburkholderia sp. BL8N3]
MRKWQRLVAAVLLCSMAGEASAVTNLIFDKVGNIVGSYVPGVPGSFERAQAQIGAVIAAKEAQMGYDVTSAQARATAEGINKAVGVSSTVVGTVANGLVTLACMGASGIPTSGVGAVFAAAGCIAAGAAVGQVIQLAVDGIATWMFKSSGPKVNVGLSGAQLGGLVPGNPY